MFDAGRGFFYLVFADPDDCFFTESYLRLDLASYLKLHLIEDDFRQLCFISKASFSDECDYKIDFAGALNKELVAFLRKKRSFSWGAKKKKGVSTVVDLDAGGENSRRIHCEYDFAMMKETLLKVIELMEYSRDAAVVCPIDVFAECCETDAVLRKLIARQSRLNHNVMLLTGSVDASENDRYFRNPSCAYPDSVPPLISRVFFNEKLFPEMIAKFDDSSSNTPKLVLTYEALKDAFAERMVVLNSLSYEKLRIAVKYVLMRQKNAELRFPPNAYAALLWAWYENGQFREKYPQLMLPDNPFRSMRVVTEEIVEHGFSPAADEVIRAELSGQYRDFVSRWYREDKGVAIVYDNSAQQSSRCYACLRELDSFLRLLKGHEKIIGSEGLRRLRLIREHFAKPSYTSVHNQVILPHERFFETENRTVLNGLTQYLQKPEWNTWDDGAAFLLYTLFDLCYRHAVSVSSMDYYNRVGELQFEKCLQAVSCCLNNSRSDPQDAVRASKFVSETVNVLRSGDVKKIQQIVVLKGASELYGQSRS